LDSIIHKIKALQEGKNLTIPKFAEGIGLTRQSVYDFLNGKTAISIKNLEKIAKYFNVPMTYFFEKDLLKKGGEDSFIAKDSEIKYSSNKLNEMNIFIYR